MSVIASSTVSTAPVATSSASSSSVTAPTLYRSRVVQPLEHAALLLVELRKLVEQAVVGGSVLGLRGKGVLNAHELSDLRALHLAEPDPGKDRHTTQVGVQGLG